MTKDIAPDLMERITSDFQENMKNSSEIQELAKKISKKTAMYREAQEYAIKTSEIMSDALLSNISADMLPDGKLYYNIAQRILQEALGESGTYGYIGTYCDEVQRIFCGECECTFRDDELWIPVSGAAVPATTWHLVLHAFCDRLHGGCVLEED